MSDLYKVKKDVLCGGSHTYTTDYPHADMWHDCTPVTKYWVTGEYGYIHTTGGEKRYWNSYSGAYKFAKIQRES